jgi:SAM-dependent methyltransferase
MRRDWDERARENARHFVVTGREQWSDEEFFASGELAMQEDILNDLTNICRGKTPAAMRVLEIGCGAGRMTRALARFFGDVCAVDISPEMVRQARHAVEDLPNAHVFCNNGKDLAPVRDRAPFDFAFSSMVFQHIPSREIIENYVREVRGLLAPGGLFKFQVQGSPHVRETPGDSWLGVPFSEAQAREMADRGGFEMRYQAGAGDQYYWLWFFRT